jgi:hypothetical protein
VRYLAKGFALDILRLLDGGVVIVLTNKILVTATITV